MSPYFFMLSKLETCMRSSWPYIVLSVLIWFDLNWSGLVWSDLIWSDLIRSDPIWSDLVWSDLIWSCIVHMILRNVMQCHFMFCFIVWYHLVVSNLALPYRIVSCLMLSCLSFFEQRGGVAVGHRWPPNSGVSAQTLQWHHGGDLETKPRCPARVRRMIGPCVGIHPWIVQVVGLHFPEKNSVDA